MYINGENKKVVSGRAANIEHKARKKACPDCGVRCPPKLRTCQCGHKFERKDSSPPFPKGVTNVTTQKKLLLLRQNVCAVNHGWQSLILMGKQSANGALILEEYASPGWVSEFFVGTENSSTAKDSKKRRRENPPPGQYFVNGFKKLFTEAHPKPGPSNNQDVVNRANSDHLSNADAATDSYGVSSDSPHLLDATDDAITTKLSDANGKSNDSPHSPDATDDATTARLSGIEQELFFKSPKDIEPRDVVPVYAKAGEPENFWLFMVTSSLVKRKKHYYNGRYLIKQDEGVYKLDHKNINSIETISIINFDQLVEEFFVFEKYSPEKGIYCLSKRMIDILESEVANLLRS